MAWGWTTLAFTGVYLTTPPQGQTWDPIVRWATATGVWLAFTGWFFGPSLFNRFLALSGAECVVHLPHEPGSTTPHVVTVPAEFCYTKTTVSPSTHPALFVDPSSASALAAKLGASWHATPRLYRGHDVSGHTFLLTLSILFLSDYLIRTRKTLRVKSVALPNGFVGSATATWGLIALWFFMLGTTAVFFHSAQEKLSGFRKLLFITQNHS